MRSNNDYRRSFAHRGRCRQASRKPDGADQVSTFLVDAVRLANEEQGTIAWFALRTDTTTFWIVDAFPSEGERQEPLDGAITSSW